MTYARVRFSRTEHGPAKTVATLVDTGSFYSVVPAPVLSSLGVRARWKEELEVADGRAIERLVGKAYVHYRGESAETFVVFGEARDGALLGAYALEGLRMEVDLRSRRLRKARPFPMFRAAPSRASE